MRRFAFLLLASALVSLSGARAETAAPITLSVNSDITQRDQEFLESVTRGGSASAPQRPIAEVQPASPRAPESAPVPVKRTLEKAAVRERPVVHEQSASVAQRVPEPAAPIAERKESKVTRVAPKARSAAPPAPRIVVREQTGRDYAVMDGVPVRRAEPAHPQASSEKRARIDRDDDDHDRDDPEERAESEAFHRALHNFFHGSRPR